MQHTLTVDNIDKFLSKPEQWLIDFKEASYNLSLEKKKGQLVKDIISIANTVRSSNEIGYILIGIRDRNSKRVVVGIEEDVDDSAFHPLVRSFIDNPPDFLYYTITYKKHKIGVFEIPVSTNGPYVSNRDMGDTLKKGIIYYRDGSCNAIASALKKLEIEEWMKGISDDSWRHLLINCKYFDDKSYTYTLFYGPNLNLQDSTKRALGNVNWSSIICLDSNNHDNSIYSNIESRLQTRRNIHRQSRNIQRVDFNLDRSTCWIDANEEEGPLVWRNWNRKYYDYVATMLKVIFEKSNYKPIICVYIINNLDFLYRIQEMVDRIFGDTSTHILVNFDKIENLIDGICIGHEITERSLEKCLSEYFHETDNTSIILPKRNSNYTIDKRKESWLLEDLEIVHNNFPLVDQDRDYDFFQGNEITWSGINASLDVNRDLSSVITDNIIRTLDRHENDFKELRYSAGMGATTIAKRVAWSVHDKYPTVFIRNYNEDTYERIEYLTKETDLPIVIIVEEKDAKIEQVRDLRTKLLSRSVTSFILMVRRYGQQTRFIVNNSEYYVLPDYLQRRENAGFYSKFCLIKPDKVRELNMLYQSSKRTLNPFMYGLTAFGRDFRSISSFVSSRIENANETQKTILLVICIIYYYGQKSVHSNTFSHLLNFPLSVNLRFDSILTSNQLSLLINHDQYYWRPLHYIIAEELISQIITNKKTYEKNWIYGLAEHAKKIIDILVSQERSDLYDDTLEILNKLFISRETVDEQQFNFLFSPLINDIPTKEGKLEVMNKLVDTVPNNPHYWGHLARLYCYVIFDYDKAIESINRAIDINKAGYLLYHIKGMCLRAKISNMLKDCNDIATVKDNFTIIISEALDCFSISRNEFNNFNLYGYVSPIQMICDFLKTIMLRFHNDDDPQAFLCKAENDWYLSLYDNAIYLFDEMIMKGNDIDAAEYITRCESLINELNGNYSKVISGWSNLLGRKDCYQPPIRRALVKAYFVRADRERKEIDKRKLLSIVEMLESNLTEEPGNLVNTKMWFDALRKMPHMHYSIENIIDRLKHCQVMNPSIEIAFYIYCIYVIQVIQGSISSKTDAELTIRDCSNLAKNHPYRNAPREWYNANKNDIFCLESDRELRRRFEIKDKDMYVSKFGKLYGQIIEIDRPESGYIESTKGQFKVFFVPAKGREGKGFVRSSDLGKSVSFVLAFSYDGLRAFEVTDG